MEAGSENCLASLRFFSASFKKPQIYVKLDRYFIGGPRNSTLTPPLNRSSNLSTCSLHILCPQVNKLPARSSPRQKVYALAGQSLVEDFILSATMSLNNSTLGCLNGESQIPSDYHGPIFHDPNGNCYPINFEGEVEYFANYGTSACLFARLAILTVGVQATIQARPPASSSPFSSPSL